MAEDEKNSKDTNKAGDASAQADIDRSDTVRHASEEARSVAIEKMKAAQSEAEVTTEEGSDELSETEGRGSDEKKVKRGEIDPDAKKALGDLLGKDETKRGNLKEVKIYSPFRVYYDNEASSVSAVNMTGPFDVLPGHRNFLSLLAPGDIVVRSPSGKEETITIDRGVMHVHDDVVRVFLDV